MKRALVLSGGGARGAFELGALEFIQEQKPSFFQFHIIAGTSVGSLNGVMVAQQRFEQLRRIWSSLDNRQVYTGNLPQTPWQYLQLAARVLFGRRSLLGIDPLVRKIREHVHLKEVKTDYRCGFVPLVSGEYVACRHTDFNGDEETFRKAILASCTMPVIWEPVPQIRIGNQVHRESVDGGIRNISPLKDVVLDHPEEIIIINCNARTIADEADAGRNLFQIAKRSLTDITINEIFRDDIEEFIKTNDIVKQARDQGVTLYRNGGKGEAYVYFNSIIIEPEEGLGDPLDFSPQSIAFRRKAGYAAAAAAFAKYEATAGPATVRSYKEA